MKIIVEGEKIISVGNGPYELASGQEEFEISNWGGRRKKEHKWKNGEIIAKTPEELEAELEAEILLGEQPIRNIVLKMIEEGIVKPGQDYEPPEEN